MFSKDLTESPFGSNLNKLTPTCIEKYCVLELTIV